MNITTILGKSIDIQKLISTPLSMKTALVSLLIDRHSDLTDFFGKTVLLIFIWFDQVLFFIHFKSKLSVRQSE